MSGFPKVALDSSSNEDSLNLLWALKVHLWASKNPLVSYVYNRRVFTEDYCFSTILSTKDVKRFVVIFLKMPLLS